MRSDGVLVPFLAKVIASMQGFCDRFANPLAVRALAFAPVHEGKSWKDILHGGQMLLGNDVNRQIAVSRDENRDCAIDVAPATFVPSGVLDLLTRAVLANTESSGAAGAREPSSATLGTEPVA